MDALLDSRITYSIHGLDHTMYGIWFGHGVGGTDFATAVHAYRHIAIHTDRQPISRMSRTLSARRALPSFVSIYTIDKQNITRSHCYEMDMFTGAP